ncbi:MAG TPA: hypothetical protein VI336_03335 [Candidatus Saccharimonadales bacterium]|nr:hypothetical protein [Candidatus Saccharimonadales bacterium]
MSNETLVLEAPSYQPPENAADFGERDIKERQLRLLLYIGETATLDIVHIDEADKPDFLVRRLEDTLDHALDLLYHTQSYMSAEEARHFFDGSRAA